MSFTKMSFEFVFTEMLVPMRKDFGFKLGKIELRLEHKELKRDFQALPGFVRFISHVKLLFTFLKNKSLTFLLVITFLSEPS